MGAGFKIVNAYAYNNVQPDGFMRWRDAAHGAWPRKAKQQ